VSGALDGLEVIDLGILVQAPQAAAMLGDLGAEVVKVELPGWGDQARWLAMAADDPRSAWYSANNRGKRSMTLDLRLPAGRDVFLRMAATADVVLSNFKPGTLEGWGLGYDDLAAINPGIVYGAGSAFGHLGPDAHREGADLAGQASGGLISSTGVDGGDPTPVAVTICDHIAGLNLVNGVLAALLHRERTGRGQRIEVSLLGGQVWAQAPEYTFTIDRGEVPGRSNRGHPMIPGIYGIFPTADGWLALVGIVGPQRARFFDAIGRPDLTDDPRCKVRLLFDPGKASLFAEIDVAMRTRTTAEWCEVLAAAELRFAPVRGYDEVLDDPQVWANGYLAKVEVGGEERTVVGSPIWFSDTPAVPGAVAPEIGQHTEELLLELGLSWEEIAQLGDAGAI
jgi:crotonobetainyl-CoA:carnitine CoA-transferase CaiB-like acyl-CoA transferase